MYESYYTAKAKEWDEALRFFMGQQHIQYSNVGKTWESIPKTQANSWMPRPIANYIAPSIMTIGSLLTRQKPTATISPNSEDEKDKNAAKLGESILDAKWEIDHEEREYSKSTTIKLITGGRFRKDYWDSSLGETVLMMGEDGKPYEGRTGDTAFEYIDPFRMIVDIVGKQFFVEQNVKPLSWVKERYSKKDKGYTGEASKVSEEKNLSTILNLQNALKTESFRDQSRSSTQDDLQNCTVVKEAYFAPTQRYKKGLMVIVCSGLVLYAAESPYYTSKVKDSWHPYNWDFWQDNPFQFHGKSYVKDLIPLQRRINGTLALIELSLRTMAMPQWLIPNGSLNPEGYISGEPGLNLFFNPVGSSGVAPQKIPGMGVDPQMWKWLEDGVTTFYMAAGTNEIMNGIRPTGVNTLGGMDLLLEQSNSKFSDQFSSSEKFIERCQGAKLRLIAKYYKENRANLVQRMKQMNKDNLEVEINDFVGSDLRDNLTVRIEAGSSIPKSKVFQQEMFKQLAQMGLFGPLDPMSNPIGNEEFLEKFGVSSITTEINADVERARWINSVLTAVNRGEMAIQQIPPIMPFDNLQIHMKVLTDEMKRPDFKDEMGAFSMRAQQIDQILQQQALEMQRQMASAAQGQAGQEIPPQTQSASHVPQDSGLPVGDFNLNNSTSPEMALNLGV
jgi:hypothetical protein